MKNIDEDVRNIDQEMELWDIITKGPKELMKEVTQGNDVENIDDLESKSKNYRSMNQFCCAPNGTGFIRISSCTSAKELWDKLVVTYEGTSQVKERKINILIH